VTQEIELVLKQREGVYRELADFVVDAGPKSPEQIATEIVAWWQSLPK
jgi:shikimate kinase